MFAFRKVPPTTYVLHYRRGKLRREGPGLAFFYFVPTATIVQVPLASADVVAEVPEGPAWAAVRDRLRRASA